MLRSSLSECFRVLAFLGLLSSAGTVFAIFPPGFVVPTPLNDTGITVYADDTLQPLETEPATHPGQDARYGRDAAARGGALSKVGAGNAGFDFTKIANNGSVLPLDASLGTSATDWGCTRDNLTGLMWEVKVADPAHLRYMGHGYSWFDTNTFRNGGDPGYPSNGTCHAEGRCDTEKFVQDVNAAQLCGYRDWRMPRWNELRSIVDYGTSEGGVAGNQAYFPNLGVYPPSEFGTLYLEVYWAGMAGVFPGSAWWVSLSNGTAGSLGYKIQPARVLLVRGRL